MTDKELRYHKAYLDMTTRWSQLSHCVRKQVGALIVKDDQIISDGYNGTPSGFDNTCEDVNGDTHWYTQHAEENAILKCAKTGNSCDGSTLYLTHSPCQTCSRLIKGSGIKRVFFLEPYKDTSGIEFLERCGIEVIELGDWIEQL